MITILPLWDILYRHLIFLQDIFGISDCRNKFYLFLFQIDLEDNVLFTELYKSNKLISMSYTNRICNKIKESKTLLNPLSLNNGCSNHLLSSFDRKIFSIEVIIKLCDCLFLFPHFSWWVGCLLMPFLTSCNIRNVWYNRNILITEIYIHT